jgi:uncharacterized RDD family membrane protein YckC
MKCLGCGHESIDRLETCKRCGRPVAADAATASLSPADPAEDLQRLRFEPERFVPGQWLPGRRLRRVTRASRAAGDLVEMLDDDAIEVGEDDLDRVLSATLEGAGDEDAPPFLIDEDPFGAGDPAGSGGRGAPPDLAAPARLSGSWSATAADLPGPAFELRDEEQRLPAGAEPIIDRDDEVPERFWAPEVAGLGRRTVALLVDQALLLATLAIFFFGALLALRLSGFDTDVLLAAAGLQVSALPFGLLAAGLSLAYCVYFHRSRGCTPGKALVGIEVRTGAGGSLSWGRAILRWLGAALGVACAGAGVCWGLFEPRRRSWADLISGTVVARVQRGRGRDRSPR